MFDSSLFLKHVSHNIQNEWDKGEVQYVWDNNISFSKAFDLCAFNSTILIRRDLRNNFKLVNIISEVGGANSNTKDDEVNGIEYKDLIRADTEDQNSWDGHQAGSKEDISNICQVKYNLNGISSQKAEESDLEVQDSVNFSHQNEANNNKAQENT